MLNEEKNASQHNAAPDSQRGAVASGPSVQVADDALQFDDVWYVAAYPDVALSGLSPYEHYIKFGRFLSRKPNPQGRLSENDGAGTVASTVTMQVARSEVQPPRARKQRMVVRGGFNLPGKEVPIIRGWMAKIGDCRPRTALLQIGTAHCLEVECNGFRSDLLENGINEGKHGFEVVLPINVIDGSVHPLMLIDKASGQLIAEEKACWIQERNFYDFSGFLENSFVSPLLYAPFREEDKRCFAVMENIADYLASLSEPLEDSFPVSVIMPVHNRLATVPEAVESVLAQTYQNFELILVDDGSTDGTYEFLSSLDDPRVVLLRNETCRGVSYARNQGLAHAKAEVICYLDSDNTWDCRYIASTVGAFQHLPEAQAVFSGQMLFRGEQELPFAVRFGSFNKALLENRNYIDLNAFAHKRHALQQSGGFDEKLSRFVDWDFILRLSQNVRTYSVPVLLSHYCYDKAANTLTNASHFMDQLDLVREKQRRQAALKGQDAPRIKDAAKNHPAAGGRSISIIIPSYQSLPDLKKCIASIQTLKTEFQIRIIVVDNASGKDVDQYLESLASRKHIRYLRNPVNYGFTRAVNQGLELADKQDDIVLLNNDATLTQGALEALCAAAYRLPQCGITVPRQVLPGRTKTISQHVPYACPEHDCDVNLSKHHSNVIEPPVFHSGEHLELSFAPFFCVYIKREILDRVPRLDEKHGRHYRSDRIFCDYIRKVLGFRIYYVSDAIVYHRLQQSTDMLQGTATNGEKEFDDICIKNKWSVELALRLGYKAPLWDRTEPSTSRN